MKTIFSILSISLASIAINAAAQTYVYDDAGRLEKIIYPSGKGVAYSYDIRDNLTQVDAIAVPPAVTNLAITALSSTAATLTWEHTGDVLLFLIQSKLKGTDDWTNGASVDDVNARSAALTLVPGEERVYRIVVYGNGNIESAPSEGIILPSQIPLMVTTLKDENDHVLGRGIGDSLREVIEVAVDGERIEFAPYLTGGKIELLHGEISVRKSITIDASPLPGRIFIDAKGESRIFSVSGEGTVAMKGLRMTAGDSSFGGALINNATDLTLEDCVISNSISSDYGGGIYNWNGGNLSLIQSTVSGNIANLGGGIFNYGTTSILETRFSTISGNTATDGGGLYNDLGLILVDRSAFSGNETTQSGGALFNNATGALIVNSTLAVNGSFNNTGAAISNNANASMTLRHSTVAQNTGTGIYNNAPAALTLDNSIIANNSNQLNAAIDIVGDYTAIGANIVRFHTGTLLGGPNPLRSDPLLNDFASYGGRSKSMPPMVGSPALDAGIVTANTPSSDQDNSFRPNGVAPELGAIESRLSSETNLEWLTTSAGSLRPVFRPSLTTYDAFVLKDQATVAFRPAISQFGQTVQVRINDGDFSAVQSKAATAELPLVDGENAVEVKVTAQNGNSTKTYAITVTRGAPSALNTDLASLSTSSDDLSPSFDSSILAYNSTVSESTSTTTVTATTAVAGATLEVRSNFGPYAALASGATSAPLPLNSGANAIDIRVTAEDGSTNTVHALTVTRESPAMLSALSTSAGALSPTFSRGVFVYNLTVPESVTSTTVSASAAQVSATLQAKVKGGDFAPLTSGAPSGQLALAAGVNEIEVEVTAPDGATRQSYTLVVTRVIETLDWISQSGNANSRKPSMSSDCRYIVFTSNASNLIQGGTNNNEHIFLYDRQADTMKLLSLNAQGQQGDRNSTDPVISADGKFVAFQSEARNLVPGDENGNNDPSSGRDIFLYDLENDTLERISVPNGGGEANQASGQPSISGDGRYVAFQSSANNLVSQNTYGNTNAYIYDRNAPTNKLIPISVPFADILTNRDSLSPAISTDGAYVAFEFSVDRNGDNQNLNYRYTDIYLYSTLGGSVERISGTKIGVAADGTKSENPSISADGRYVAFESNLEDIDFYDTNKAIDIFVYDRVEGTTRRVSAQGSTGGQLFRDSTNPSISGNGQFVAFESMASNLVDSDTNDEIDIFITDLATGELSLASVSQDGTQGNGYSYQPALSFDGSCMVFYSAASNFNASDTNSVDDIFVAETKAVAPSSLTGLANLTSNLGGLSQEGNALAASVSTDLEFAQIRPFTADPGASIQVRINSGSPESIPANAESTLVLDSGENVIELKVTAADGITTETFTLTAARTIVDDSHLRDADLTSLATSAGETTPAFARNLLSYSLVVPNETKSATISPSLSQDQATLSVNGNTVSSGSPSAAFNLSVGSNVFLTTVTAPDGSTKKTYAMAITRLPAEPENIIPITGVEIVNGSPKKLRISWQSEADAIYVIESSSGLQSWASTDSEIISGGESTTTEIELNTPSPSAIFIRLRLK